jgi:hypothetical protein
VVPVAATAAMRAFSVPVTLGSSRKMSAPTQPLGAELDPLAELVRGPHLLERQEVGVERRRPITSPPGGC